MKNTYILSLMLGSVVLGAGTVYANNGGPVPTVAPVVSIGVGNGNTPANTGPVHESTVSGSIDVYATVSDTDLENYHFRVIKDGGSQGHTCTTLGGLFAPENQGYASSTLSREACGFSFNQSVYTGSTGFVNTLIATLNTEDLKAFGGEGDYWLVIGGVDIYGSRTHSDYLNDPKVKVTITNATSTSTPPAGGTSTGTSSTSGGEDTVNDGTSGQFSRSSGIVLGAYTGSGLGGSCGLYMDKFIRSGRINDVEQVKKLQVFLNKRIAAGLPITGFYGPATEDALSTFQGLYAGEILTPWGLTSPTGIVYQTTLRWINVLECPGISLPIPVLIAWSKNPDVPALAQPVLLIPTFSAPVSEGEIGGEGEGSQEDESTGGFWSFIRNLFSN